MSIAEMVAGVEKLIADAVPQALEVFEKAEPHAEAVTTLVELAPRLEQIVTRLEQVLPAVEQAIAAPGSTAERAVGAVEAALTPTTVTVGDPVVPGAETAAAPPVAAPAVDPLDELTPKPAPAPLPEPPAPTEQ